MTYHDLARTPTFATGLARTVSPRTHGARWYRFAWSAQTHTCCADQTTRGTPQFRLDANDAPPLTSFDPDSDGSLAVAGQQCGRCGQRWYPDVDIIELEGTQARLLEQAHSVAAGARATIRKGAPGRPRPPRRQDRRMTTTTTKRSTT